jgi:hypothetical protein
MCRNDFEPVKLNTCSSAAILFRKSEESAGQHRVDLILYGEPDKLNRRVCTIPAQRLKACLLKEAAL